MKINIKTFQELVDVGYLNVQKHPTEDLLIWNYTAKCQYESFWHPETMMARGLITDSQGNVKATPLKKFFNLSEYTDEDSKLPPLPIEEFTVTDKMDGSLGISYWIGDKMYLATRGSFTSEQAIKGTEILHKKNGNFHFNPTYTYLFEIIYPQNRIVIDYKGLEDIILLAMIQTDTGIEVDCSDHKDYFTVVKKYDGITDINKIKEIQRDNAEGFVIRFKSGGRAKIKYDEYVRLHRLITGVNAKTIWDLLRNHQSFDELLDKVPDEYYDWVKKTKEELLSNYRSVEVSAIKIFDIVKVLPTRKDQALTIMKNDGLKKYSGIVFKKLDSQPYEDLIWKMVRPVASKPFHDDIDI